MNRCDVDSEIYFSEGCVEFFVEEMNEQIDVDFRLIIQLYDGNILVLLLQELLQNKLCSKNTNAEVERLDGPLSVYQKRLDNKLKDVKEGIFRERLP